MNLEQQVCSLGLSKKLKELGVKQESLFWWCDFGKDNDWRGPYYSVDGDTLTYAGTSCFGKDDCRNTCSAFTVAELGEMLRKEESELPTYLDSTHEWVAVYDTTLIGGAETEADARAKMLIYLLENKLITL